MLNRSVLEEQLWTEIADAPFDFFAKTHRNNPHHQERTVNIGDKQKIL
uniref:Uncharacterized protein n=1 Tax=Candidatus Methanogaster sp. ANME-2c ERB4 TaxID=2759911 RepID=A0A7G9YIN3_9EURY|nr:hypothetical protein DJFEGNLO_00021 [Methanosarcinales archaeon ANME-2c ERB4]